MEPSQLIVLHCKLYNFFFCFLTLGCIDTRIVWGTFVLIHLYIAVLRVDQSLRDNVSQIQQLHACGEKKKKNRKKLWRIDCLGPNPELYPLQAYSAVHYIFCLRSYCQLITLGFTGERTTVLSGGAEVACFDVQKECHTCPNNADQTSPNGSPTESRVRFAHEYY